MYNDQVLDTHGRPTCRECLGETLHDEESGEDVCVSCGAVATSSNSYLQLPPSRVAMARELNRNPMASVMRSDLEMPTLVGNRNIDAKGRQIGENYELRQLRRLGAIVSWDPKRRRMAKVSTEIRQAAEALGLSSAVSVRAYEIYAKAFDSKGAKVKSVSAAAAAAVCAACLELEIPRPPDDMVAHKVNIDERKLRYHYKILVKGISVSSVPNPAIYVSSIAAKASVDGATERRALDILTLTKGSEALIGKRPVSIAAAALYLASLESRDPTTQMRLAFSAGVSPITIRKRSGEIANALTEKGRQLPP
jgi:transcription initiation factor TFIIB